MTRIAAVLLGLGALTVVSGIYLISTPAAVITAGVLLVGAGVLSLERT